MKPHDYYQSLKLQLLLFAAVIFTAFFLAVIPGCNGDSAETQSGTLRVYLTDAPASEFAAVNVTIEKVRIHQSASAAEDAPGWREIVLNPAQKINLLDYTNGLLLPLGELPLAAGHYTQLRLVLADSDATPLANSVILAGTETEIPLATPSAVQSGLKLINAFAVVPGERVDLILDFHACKSIVHRGNGTYGLKPVIRVLPVALSGIEGVIAPSALVTVSAQQGGAVIRSTIANAEGDFFLSHLESGSYDIVITADDLATAVVTGVPVTTGKSTMVSSKNDPITLQASASRTISGTITLTAPVPATTSVADVSARQELSGTTVTVQEQTIDILGSSTYSLTLPNAAPWLGAYGGGSLPITLTAQTAAAGVYRLAAAADGYEEGSAEISSGDVIHDFTLPLLP